MNDIFYSIQFPDYKYLMNIDQNVEKQWIKIESLTSGTIWCLSCDHLWNYFIIEGYLTSGNWLKW